MSTIEVFCFGCGGRGKVAALGQRIQHTCGSEDVDLWLDSDEQRRRIAALTQPEPKFIPHMTTRVATKPVGDEIPGWDEYQGPLPGPNELIPAPQHTKPGAPTKRVPGVPMEPNAYVYDKNDPPPGYGENPPAPQVAPHHYPNHANTSPYLGHRSAEGVLLTGAACPQCDSPSTTLRQDARAEAHWYCQRRCGSLINLDKHPRIDPFQPPTRDWGLDAFRTRRAMFAGKKPGQVMPRLAVISRINPGLNMAEALHLARRSVEKYPEA